MVILLPRMFMLLLAHKLGMEKFTRPGPNGSGFTRPMKH